MNTAYKNDFLNLSRKIFYIQRCCYCYKIYRVSATNRSTKIPDLEKFTPDKIRNFGIVAHVDHGKSTLADRLLTLTNVIKAGERDQFLDKLQVERERGITVKAQSCSMVYKGHLLNLIDTPGHVDFNFEVTRSLAACNGILLLVAANEGMKAQTKANFRLAFERDLTILPVINKIDMKNANIPMVVEELSTLGFIENEMMKISARSGENVPQVLDRIIKDIPSPIARRDAPFRALIFDSWFLHDSKRGGIPLIFVKEGSVKPGQKIRTFYSEKEYEVLEVGIMYPEMQPCETLYAGQVGYIFCNMKTAAEASIGETIFEPSQLGKVEVFPGFKPTQPTVYAGLYPVESSEYEELKKAVERLRLNDPSVSMSKDTSPVLGHGFKMGFLGMLHMEVFGQRLKDEYNAEVILTAPSVRFKARVVDNETIRKKRFGGESEVFISDPSKYPEFPKDIEKFFEPITKVTMDFPSDCTGDIISVCQAYRGEQLDNIMLNEMRTRMIWRLPDSEIMMDFFNKLMSVTSGEIKYDQEHAGYKEVNLIKINVLINGKLIDEFSQLSPTNLAPMRAKELVERLKEEIPRQQYEVEIKANIGTSKKSLASAKLAPLKKDFSSRLKGNFSAGRALKKIKEQKEGKERLKQIGNIQVPKEAFINILRRD